MLLLAQHGTSARTEVIGGVATYLATAYIIVVNPAIGRAREINAGSIVLAVLCQIYYVFGLPH
ncbi:MAG: hypothetical protein DMD91_27765 [Candidatus Rokuibacteriota bacterium]|nr:MAG: hypothetical protein DMD91_27765 [Candidatus Rokubacteria bacterium]